MTERPQQIARCVARGLTNKEVAQEIYLNLRAVQFHVLKLKERTGSKSRDDLRRWVAERDPNRRPAQSLGPAGVIDTVRLIDQWILEELWPEQLPAVAVSLLLEGADSQSLRLLASMHRQDDPQELRELFNDAVAELGIPRPHLSLSLAREVGRIVAEVLAGQPDVFQAAAKLSSLSPWFPQTPQARAWGIVAGIEGLRTDFRYYGLTRAEAETKITDLALDLKATLQKDLGVGAE